MFVITRRPVVFITVALVTTLTMAVAAEEPQSTAGG